MPLFPNVENAVADYLFGGTAFTPPGTYYLALSTSNPALSVSEPLTSLGYERVSLPSDYSFFNAAYQDANHARKDNDVSVVFPAATGNWGSIGWWVLYDAATGGNPFMYGLFTPLKVVTSGDVFEIPAAELVLRIGGA